MAVQEYQLAGEDDEPLRHVAVKRLVASVQQLHQFAGITAGGRILQFATGVEGDARLGGVRYHEAHLRLVGQRHEGRVLRVGVQCAAYHVYALYRVHGLTVLAALQVDVVQAVLPVQHVHHTLLDGLHHHHRAVEVSLLVHVPDNPIHKCAQEVTLAELYHLFRHHALRSELFVKWFHVLILFLLLLNFCISLQRYDYFLRKTK